MADLKIPVHVEAQIRDGCTMKQDDIISLVKEKLEASCPVFQNGEIKFDQSDDIYEYCVSVKIGEICDGKVVSFWQAEICVHAYRLSDQEPEVKKLGTVTDVLLQMYCFSVYVLFCFSRRNFQCYVRLVCQLLRYHH